MLFNKLKEIIDDNSIPYDVELLSDSGWECNETEIGSIYYNKEDNTIVLKQAIFNDKEAEYNNKKYNLIYNEKEDKQ